MKIDKDHTRNHVSVNRAKVALMVKEMPAEDNSTRGYETDADREETPPGDTRLKEENVINALQE